MWAGHGWILPLVKWAHFFLGPWLLVSQFIEFSNQMDLNGEVWNFGYFIKNDFYCNSQSFRDFPEAPFNWKLFKIVHTKCQGHMKWCPHFSSFRVLPRLPVFRVVLLHTEPAVQHWCPDSIKFRHFFYTDIFFPTIL